MATILIFYCNFIILPLVLAFYKNKFQMKNFFTKLLLLLFLALNGSLYGQQTDYQVTSLNWETDQAKTVNVLPSKLESEQRNAFGVITTPTFEIPVSSNPFFTVAIEHSEETTSYEKILIGLSNKEDVIEEWIEFVPDSHNEHEGKIISELLFIEKAYKYFALEVAFIRNLNYENIQVHFYSPGNSTPISKNENTQNSSPESCPCPQPTYLNRSQWCPNGNCPPHPNPSFTTTTHLIIHHSAGTNTSSDWGAVVRSIWNYHVNTNGWSDVGYNWLVDPNGVLYEGRGDNVLGAHFCGTNGSTMGVCVLGDFTTVTPTTNAIDQLSNLLAWKSCDASISPLGSAFHGGSNLTLNHISGHRDGCSTACPGDAFYPMIPNIRTSTQTNIDSCASQSPSLQAPTNLNATAISGTTIELTWTDNSTTEASFIIERSEMFNTFYNIVGTVPADTTMLIQNNLTPQTGYFYKIRAANASDTSDYSNEVFVATQPSNIFYINNDASISVYPNPIQDILFIKMENEILGTVQMEVLDITGKQILNHFSKNKTSTLFEYTLNVNDLAKGIYILKMRIDDKVWVQKLVK